MKYVLSFFLIFVAFPVHSEIYKETHVIDMILPERDRDYDRDVKYKLRFEGLKNYKVTLETWKFVDIGEFASKTLRKQAEDVLFDNIEVEFELMKRDPFHDNVSIASVVSKSRHGEISFVRPPGSDIPRYGTHKMTVRSNALKNVFRSSDEKVFYPDLVWFGTVNVRYGKFEPAVNDVEHGSYEIGGGFDGPDRSTVHFMKATLYGNDIRSMKFCKGAVAYKPDRLDLETLARQGFASLYLEGAHKGSCFQFLNKDGKVLLEKTF